MVNHPNINWRKRWRVDLAARTAEHESGLIVRFAAEPDEDGGIDGEVVAGMPALSADRAAAEQQANRLARLLREAGEIYGQHLRRGRLPP